MNTFLLFDISIYEVIDLIPCLILAISPFRNFMRFSRKITALFILVLYILTICGRLLALYNAAAAAVFTVFWVFLYFGFYMVTVKASPFKILFVLLTILNYTSFAVIIFSHFVYHRFPSSLSRPYSLYASAVLAAVYLISYPLVYWLIIPKMTALIKFPENNRYWNFLWLMPATFCLSYYYNLYANRGIIAFSGRVSNMLFAVFLNLGALFVTYLVMLLLAESNSSLELKAENYQLHMQTLEYQNFQGRIEDARRARHDLRQSLAVLQSFVQKEDTRGMQQYLQNYLASLPSDSPILYCENYAVNALIVYYADLARTHKIDFEVDARYPSETKISTADCVVLLGNLLENAVEACIRQNIDGAYIVLHMQFIKDMLVITLDNSYSGEIVKQGAAFISSKTSRPGIGTSSIKKITEKHRGVLKLDYGEGQFHASVMLCQEYLQMVTTKT